MKIGELKSPPPRGYCFFHPLIRLPLQTQGKNTHAPGNSLFRRTRATAAHFLAVGIHTPDASRCLPKVRARNRPRVGLSFLDFYFSRVRINIPRYPPFFLFFSRLLTTTRTYAIDRPEERTF